MTAGVNDAGAKGSQRTLQRESSDEYDDYDDQYVDTYPARTADSLPQKLEQVHLDNDLPDTTMLDSVILPAIASVGANFFCVCDKLLTKPNM